MDRFLSKAFVVVTEPYAGLVQANSFVSYWGIHKRGEGEGYSFGGTTWRPQNETPLIAP